MNVETAEASARAAAILRKQATRWRAQGDAQDRADPSLRFEKPGQQLRDEAALAEMHADLIVAHAKARAAYETAFAAVQVDAAAEAVAGFDGDVKALRQALSVRGEDGVPAEHAALQTATAELADTARLWRGIGLAAGSRGRRSEWVQDHVDDTPDPADVAAILEEVTP